MDIVAEGYDAGVRLSEAIERDMVQVRLTDSFRFVVVGAPEYLARTGTPERPEDLLRHECITFRSQTTRRALRVGARARAPELARARSWRRRQQRLGVRGVAGRAGRGARVRLRADGRASTLARRTAEASCSSATRPRSPASSSTSPASRGKSAPLRLFVEAAKELAVRTLAD